MRRVNAETLLYSIVNVIHNHVLSTWKLMTDHPNPRTWEVAGGSQAQSLPRLYCGLEVSLGSMRKNTPPKHLKSNSKNSQNKIKRSPSTQIWKTNKTKPRSNHTKKQQKEKKYRKEKKKKEKGENGQESLSISFLPLPLCPLLFLTP